MAVTPLNAPADGAADAHRQQLVATLDEATAPVRSVGITGIGTDLPGRVVTNDDLEQRLDTTDEWIRTRTGILRRHVVDDRDATSDLAVRAGRAALDDAGVRAADLVAVIVATTTPDHLLPGTAPIVAAQLGTGTAAFDLNAACSGFVYGLWVAGALAASGPGPVLLIGAETLTKLVDDADRSTAILFGDGAGATVVAPQSEGTVGPFDLGCDGSLADILCVPAGGSRRPADAESVADRQHYLRMQGREVYRHAVRRMSESSQVVLDAAGIGPDAVDLFVGHQANLRILDAVAERVGIPPERCHITVDQHGNTSSASVPLALDDARASGRLRPGMRVLLTAFGAGLTWGSCLVTTGSHGGVPEDARE